MWIASVFMVVFLLFGWMATGLAQENIVDINALTQAFRDAKRVRVVVRQTYEKADKVSLPFYEYAEKILNYAGLSVVEEDATTYDVTISIEAKGIPGSARYRGTISGSHWTKATVKGKISFSAGDKTFRWDFSYTEGPDQTIYRSYTTPNNAPFKASFNGGFIPAFLNAIAKVLGMPPLIYALEHEDESVRDTAAKILRELGDLYAVEPLISALKDKNWRVREWAVEALGVLKDPRAVEPLIFALKDESQVIRVAVAKVLRELKDLRAVEPLISALKDEDGVVRFWAAAALEKITGKNFGKDEAKWRDWLGTK